MIQTYSIDYRTQLCEFFSRIIESHKAYISHGELQMGIALESNELAPNYKEMWLNYLDRQVENPDALHQRRLFPSKKQLWLACWLP